MTNTKAWKLNSTGILRSIGKVLKTGDTQYLTKDAYTFLNLTSGFIAHYDINGFRYHYRDVDLLRKDLLRSSDMSDPERYLRDGYFSKGEQSEYYAAKAYAYIELKKMLAKIPVPPKTCPKCGKKYTTYPALSRRDNSTLICPDCGLTEALEDYAASMKRNSSSSEVS